MANRRCNDDPRHQCAGDPAGLDADQDRQAAEQLDRRNQIAPPGRRRSAEATKSMKRLVPGLLMMLETSINFREPYTMNTADISIRLAKITMSDIFPSR